MAAAKVVITGAAGQLGQSFASLVSDESDDFKFFIFDKKELNLTRWNSVEYTIRSIAPDIIINCAAYTNVAEAEIAEAAARELNVAVPGRLGMLANEIGCRVIHFSTDYVFDGLKTEAYTESDVPNPLNVYGKTKAEGEMLLMTSGCDYWIIRTSWLFSSFGENFVTKMLRMARERGEIRVVNDQIGSPTYAPDLARAVLSALRTKIAREVRKGLVHLANNGSATWFELAKKAVELSDIEARVISVTSDAFPSPVVRPAHSILSSRTFETTFGISMRPWEAALAACVNEIKHKQKTS
jgi:dTDP-4-dehydrorhamnose reductase